MTRRHAPTARSRPLTIHEMRARTARELDASARRTLPPVQAKIVERDPVTTPDPADEARWAAERTGRRIAAARGGL